MQNYDKRGGDRPRENRNAETASLLASDSPGTRASVSKQTKPAATPESTTWPPPVPEPATTARPAATRSKSRAPLTIVVTILSLMLFGFLASALLWENHSEAPESAIANRPMPTKDAVMMDDDVLHSQHDHGHKTSDRNAYPNEAPHSQHEHGLNTSAQQAYQEEEKARAGKMVFAFPISLIAVGIMFVVCTFTVTVFRRNSRA